MRSLVALSTVAVLAVPLASNLRAAQLTFPGSGAGGHVFALENFQGSLIAAGEFTSIGGVTANRIARYDGTSWSSLGAAPIDGVDGRRFARVFDVQEYNGKLYVGGAFRTAGGVVANNVACWDELGQTWTPLGAGTNGWVLSMEVYDDGTGPALYVGGDFQTAGGVTTGGLAKWSDATQTWSSAGTFDGPVNALVAGHFEGSDRLFVGGEFDVVGPTPARNLVQLTGNTFSPVTGGVGDGVDGVVLALSFFDDGGGLALFVGGDFQTAGNGSATRIAFWRGGTWSPLGTGVGGNGLEDVRTMVPFDDGGGPVLVVGGQVTRVGNVALDTTGGAGPAPVPVINSHGDPSLGAGNSLVGSWDGTGWSPVGQNMNDTVFDMIVFAGDLYAAGRFTSADNAHMQRIARWNTSTNEWVALGTGLGTSHAVHAFAELNRGVGQAALFVAGDFVTAGSNAVNRIARWDDGLAGFVPLGAGVNGSVRALEAIPGGLVVGGSFRKAGGAPANHIAMWNAVGTSWSPLGVGVNGTVRAVLSHDDGTGGALYAGGDFTRAGGARADYIARWDGASWAPVPAGGFDGPVRALVRFQGDLVAGGDFGASRNRALTGVARWDGTAWSNVGTGFDGDVHALHVTPNGLFAGGEFSLAGAVPTVNIARWNGFAWLPVGGGIDGPVAALSSNVGLGVLYAGGRFTSAGGAPASNVAQWDGAGWSDVGGGTDDWVRALHHFGVRLYAGGNFNVAAGASSMHIVGFAAP
jgi:hypothetical protein